MDADTLAIYLRIPFCLRRCAYCDFFSTDGKRRLIPGYVRALIREIEHVSAVGIGRSSAAFTSAAERSLCFISGRLES